MSNYPGAVDQIAAGLDAHDFRTREGVAIVLGKLNQNVTVPSLLAHVRDPNSSVRAEVVRALGGFNGDEVHRAVLTASQDPEAIVRNAAAEVLRPDSPDSVQRLRMLAQDDPSIQVRRTANESLTGGEIQPWRQRKSSFSMRIT